MIRSGRSGGVHRSSRFIAVLLLIVAAAAVLPSAAEEESPAGEAAGEISLRVELDRSEVELGAPFSLVVVRAWREGLRPEPWEEAWPEGMQARREARERRSLPGGFVEERIRYTGRAFTLRDLVLPAMAFRARPAGGGADRVARSRPVTLRVKRLLDPAHPGGAELPPGLPAVPPRSSGWIRALAAAALLLAGGCVRFLRNRARRAAVPPPGPRTPRDRALAVLADLRGGRPAGREEMDACHTALSGTLRTFLEDGLGVRALARTTEELRVDPRLGERVPPGLRTLLFEVLAAADRVAFGGAVPAAGEWRALLARAERFVSGVPEEGARGEGVRAGEAHAAGGKEAHP